MLKTCPSSTKSGGPYFSVVDRTRCARRDPFGVWLYFLFTLSFRNVEELLAQREIEVSYETIRCWTLKFGPLIAANLRRRRYAVGGDGTWMRWW
jgi:hypothetical protein